MTFQQELNSWLSPSGTPSISEPLSIGSSAPDTPKLSLPSQKPSIIAFLRHCGCPFAEKTFLNLRTTAQQHSNIDFVAVSHSSAEATEKWHKSLPPPPNGASSDPSNLRIVVDDEKQAYAAWGLGTSDFAHVLSPGGLLALVNLGRSEGITNRPTESGSRWQTSGSYAVGADGAIKWGGPSARADDVPDYEDAVKAVEAN